jgi:hypothetical protein
VPGGKANYDSTLKNTPTVTTFRFPQDDLLRKKWLQAIPRKQWTPAKTSAVCINHFHQCDIILKQIWKDAAGNVKELLLQHPRLKPGAIPKVFQNLPSYLSVKEVPQRMSPDVRRERSVQRASKVLEEFLNKDFIRDFTHLKSDFKVNIEGLQNWNFKLTDAYIYFYKLNIDCDSSCELSVLRDVKIVCSIAVSCDMVISVKQNNKEVSVNDLKWIKPCDLKLTRWSQLEDLLVRYKTVEANAVGAKSAEYYLNKINSLIQECLQICKNDETFMFANHLELIDNQIKLMSSKNRSYTPFTIVFCFLIYGHSPATYSFLRDYLVLPNKSYLQKMTSSFHINANDRETNNYLQQVSSGLSEREKYVLLLADEIYIKKNLTFKAQNIVGCASNNTDIAKTVQTFMISSCFGHFKAVVSLIPVYIFLKTLEITGLIKKIT